MVTTPLQIYGTIQSIETEENNGREKKVLTLKINNSNILFVEFQGKSKELLSEFRKGNNVLINVRFNGKVSNLGRRYNNIIAKSIQYADNN